MGAVNAVFDSPGFPAFMAVVLIAAATFNVALLRRVGYALMLYFFAAVLMANAVTR